jgi:hypothetical protein
MKNPIHRYTELKDELMDYTDDFHDAMMYDIEGYYSEQLDDEDKADLVRQVEAFENILKGYKALKYKFG